MINIPQIFSFKMSALAWETPVKMVGHAFKKEL